jgi:hypothetical protein
MTAPFLLTPGECLEVCARRFEIEGQHAEAARTRAVLAQYAPIPSPVRRALASMREHAAAGRFDIAWQREAEIERAGYFLPVGVEYLRRMLAREEAAHARGGARDEL